jgi:hypothetical protein
LRGCVETGNQLIGQALALEPAEVKNAQNLDPKPMTDEELKSKSDVLKVFESARSYNASLKVQAMRLAEMEGRNEDRDRLKAEADQAKAQFTQLSEANRALQNEIDARKAVAEEAANANANANKSAAK